MEKMKNVSFSIELEINIEETDYFVREGEILSTEMRLQLRGTQSPFTVTLYPISISEAISQFNLQCWIFISIHHKATAGNGTHDMCNIKFLTVLGH